MINPISIIKTRIGFSIPEKKKLLKTENTRTIAILIKLLATNIVAKRRFGLLSKVITRCNLGSLLFSLSSSIALSCKEKKATSAPDINAEHINKKITTIPCIQIKLATNKDIVSKGSGSNQLCVFKMVNHPLQGVGYPPNLWRKKKQEPPLLPFLF